MENYVMVTKRSLKIIIKKEIICFFLFTLPFSIACSKNKCYMRFNSEIWKMESSAYDTEVFACGRLTSLRYLMLESLVHDFLPGKNIQQVNELLGLPISLKSKTKENNSNEPYLIYVLGYADANYQMDVDIILIYFDKNGRFKSYKISSS